MLVHLRVFKGGGGGPEEGPHLTPPPSVALSLQWR